MLKDKKIGFIGAGTMAKAIIKGLINSGLISKNNISATEISPKLAQKAAYATGINVITNNNDLVANSQIIILCTKPFAVKSVLEDIKNSLTEDKLVVSIAAGISTETIEKVIEKQIPVIRVMPNIPALVGEGMSAICRGKFAVDAHSSLVMEIFKAVGRCIEVDERLINAVTGISGSGPAFIYLIIEALSDGGVKLGLKKEIAIELASQTMLGAAKMVLETGKHPALLKDEVTTPGGCTIAGLAVMENEKIRSALIKTVQETAKSAEELGKNIS